jgi:hypothetical protein
MTPAIGTQRFGAYALATFSPCGNREGAASAYVEIRAQGKLRTVSGSIMSLNTGFPSAAVDVLGLLFSLSNSVDASFLRPFRV